MVIASSSALSDIYGDSTLAQGEPWQPKDVKGDLPRLRRRRKASKKESVQNLCGQGLGKQRF